MKTFKKTFVGVILLVVMCLMTFTAVSVNAARVHIIKDNNPSGVVILSLDNESYSIEVDEETGYGYVVYEIDGEEEILGTCSVVVLDTINKTEYVLCYEEEGLTSYGEMIVVITNEVASEGVIYSIEGKLEELFDTNDTVIIEE